MDNRGTFGRLGWFPWAVTFAAVAVRARAYFANGALWLIGFGACYWFSVRHLTGDADGHAVGYSAIGPREFVFVGFVGR